MPCHPDRVRRNHEPELERAALDRLFTEARQRIADQEQQARDAAAADGITANVIEGEPETYWGV